MRTAALLLVALAFLTPLAAASQDLGVSVGATPTLPTASCPTCLGVDAHAGVGNVAGCFDCPTLGAEASVQTDGSAVTGHILVCRGGFVYVCLVDESFQL